MTGIRINKGVIKSKAPSVYMKDFADQNSKIATHMKHHLIGDFDEYGITTDDYNAFFESRIKAIHGEMISLLIERSDDDFVFDKTKQNASES